MSGFIHDDFILQNDTARQLYHDYAAGMAIYDYHCHLPAADIANDTQFENITQVWLYGDHYKWRAMRTNGVSEQYCTGNASDREKFEAWAATVPHCIKNPLYHWTHLELKRYFDIDELLTPETARSIWDRTSEMLKSPEFSVRGLIRKMNVKLICTTEDPLDPLLDHARIKEQHFDAAVHTAFRPDKAMNAENVQDINNWIERLEDITGHPAKDCYDFIDAIRARHDFFHHMGCRLSDHGLDTAYAYPYDEKEINAIYRKIRTHKPLDRPELLKFKSAMMVQFALMDHSKGWIMQLHLGAQRNNNTRMLKALGPDTGFDSIGDHLVAAPLARFLDSLDMVNSLPKTVLYNLNPRDNEVIATMLGNFQDGTVPGKMQYGSGWWFLDQKDGMEKQMTALANLGLLSRFVGMLTDSRSFLSYPRHEYFRRILCNMLGTDIEKGLIPRDIEHIGKMVQDICYNNAVNYFNMELK